MSFGGGKFRRIYPNKGSLTFDGGLNSKYAPSLIDTNESPSCQNVIFGNGTVETRPGIAKLNTTSVGSFVCDGIYTRRGNDAAETMVAWFGGTLWQMGTTTFTTIASAQSIFTAGVRVGSDQDENHIFFGNGGSIPYKYNGTAFTRHGVYPPTTTSVVASNAAGALTGDYRYKVSYVNSASVEGDVGPATTTFPAAAAQLRVTAIPVAPQSFGVNARKLYRTTAGGSSFKLVTTISDNTTTQYDDSTLDAALGDTAPTDNGVPPKYNAIVYHQNRLFMNDTTNDNYVWYTELANPYVVATTNFIRVGNNTGDTVKGLAVYDNSVVVYCQTGIYIIYIPDPDDPATWIPIKSRVAYGSSSPYAIANFKNGQLFVATQDSKIVGIANFAGDTVEPSASLLTVSTVGSEFKTDRLEPDIFQFQEGFVNNVSSINFQNKVYITATYGSGQTANNRIYVMDYSIANLSKNQQEAWVPFTGLSAAQFAIWGGNLYYGSSLADGFAHKLNTTVYNDNGAAIDSYYLTKEFSGYDDEFNYVKDHRFANVLVDNAGNYNMSFNYKADSDSDDVGTSVDINLNSGGSLWGTARWGTDLWGGGADQKDQKISLAGIRGKRIQFRFSNKNTADQRFKVHRLNYNYNLKGYR